MPEKNQAIEALIPSPPPILRYMGYIGMCGPKGYGFQPFWS